MRLVMFRVLGSAHGIAGIVTFCVVILVAYSGGVAALSPGPHKILGVTGGVITLLSLVACGVATWRCPRMAAPLAWLAATAYILTAALQGILQFGSAAPSFLLANFYYSAAVRVAAALSLMLLGLQFRQGANYSLKRTAAGRLQ